MFIQPHELTLVLDCSNKNTTVALVSENKIVDFIHEEPCNPSGHLAKFLDELLKRQNKSAADVQNVLFCRGPGSFTSLRVGLAFLKGLFWGSEVKYFSASSELFHPKNPKIFLKIISEKQYQQEDLSRAALDYGTF
jgi:tRNA threonylcarbamoyladenosine biosynthesis protein TsaB